MTPIHICFGSMEANMLKHSNTTLEKKLLQNPLCVNIETVLKNLSFSKKRTKQMNLFLCSIIVIIIFILEFILFLTGGVSSYIHLMYIPIILAVFLFGTPCGMLTALFAGLLVGPILPSNIQKGIMQEPHTWILRIVMFVVVVLFDGLLISFIKKNNDLENRNAYLDIITGYPNFNKFKFDLNECINEGLNKTFSIMIFELENFETISRYVDHKTGQQAFTTLLHRAKEYFSSNAIYTISSNKFIVVFSKYTTQNAYNLAKNFITLTKAPFYINGIPIAIVVKCGADNFSLHNNNIITIIEKLGKALDQAHTSSTDIMFYNNELAEHSKKYYHTLVSIYQGIHNNTFRLVYQPKVRLRDNKLIGVEVLLRWNDDSYRNFPISEVIKIAEDAEFINEITKWVIKNSISQLKTWQDQGLEINIAINLSSKDLMDNTVLEYTKECINLYKINPRFLEFELTERSIIHDENRVFEILKEFQTLGIKVSLDDYGTGHNSLVYLVKSIFTFNYLKIDKLFTDSIMDENTKILLDGIIKAAHGLGIEVIAEGVETIEQLHILETIGCDIIQGYYYSKPLPPKELEGFILNYSESVF